MEIVTSNKSTKPMRQSLKDAQKRYYEKNRAKILEQFKEYNKTHKEILHKACKIYYNKNRETLIKNSIEYRKKKKASLC